jgi:parallel beta-helix repeat protein
MSNRIFSGILVSLLLVGMLTLAFKIQPLKAQPTTITVPDDYPTIQEAVNHASEGEHVFVRSGIYRETVRVNKTIALIGEGRETTTVDWGIIIEANDVTVNEFTVRNNSPAMDESSNYGIWLKGPDCLISNNILKDYTFEGIFLDGRNRGIHGNTVINNSFLNDADCGILLWSCNDSLIESNVENGNSLGYFGIVAVYGSCRNSIENNQVSDNSMIGIAIERDSSANFVINNTVLNNGWGFRRDWSSGICLSLGCVSNLIVGNTLNGNFVGLYQRYESNNNTIYHNSFVNNGVQFKYDAEFPCENVWDNGYPSGGNYWSDYAGKDLLGGPYQNVSGNDGIGDTWYVLDANNTDRYPLMKPYVPLLGDLNGDNTVNMQDVIAVLDAFGSYPSHPRWNPIADINSDGRIDMEDIIIVLTNFGQHYP